MQIPRRKSDQFKKRDEGPIYLTEEGLKNMREKLAHFKHILPHLISETTRTAAYGDRSDNAEYKDAKASLRRAHYQIASLEDQLKRVIIIKKNINSDKVGLGATVVLEINGTQKTFEIVGPHETNPTLGRISNQSPLGAAIMNRKKGEVVTIETTKGQKVYRILEIR